MRISDVLFLGDRNQIAVLDGGSVWLTAERANPLFIGETYGRREVVYDLMRPGLLAACPFGIHLAFWDLGRESFYLVDITGEPLWSARMNSDKAVAHDIRFSTSGDAVACMYEFDGVPGMFFCDFNEGIATTFGCSGCPIGYDADLRYFAIDSYDPYEDEKLVFFEHEGDSGNLVVVPPQVIAQKLEQNPLLVDRQRCILAGPVVPMRRWKALAIQEGLAGFVVLKDGNLYWFNKDTAEPDAIQNCLTEKEQWDWYHPVITLSGDDVLIQSEDRAVVVNRNSGLIWRGNELDSVMLNSERILARYRDRGIELFRHNGSLEMQYQAPSGFRLLTANLADDLLTVACMSEMSRNVAFKTFDLKHPGEFAKDKATNLVEALSNADPDVRRQAAIDLGEINDSGVVEPLIRALYDDFVKVRKSAVEALAKIGDISAVSDLCGTYLGADYDPENRPVTRFIDSRRNSEQDNWFLAQAILQIGLPAVDILQDIVENKGSPEFYDSALNRIRWEVALLTLWSRQDERSELIVNGLIRHIDSWVRRRFAGFLGGRKEARATDLLFEEINDKRWEVREDVAQALGNKTGTDVEQALRRLLEDENSEVRQAAAASLKKLESYKG